MRTDKFCLLSIVFLLSTYSAFCSESPQVTEINNCKQIITYDQAYEPSFGSLILTIKMNYCIRSMENLLEENKNESEVSLKKEVTSEKEDTEDYKQQ